MFRLIRHIEFVLYIGRRVVIGISWRSSMKFDTNYGTITMNISFYWFCIVSVYGAVPVSSVMAISNWNQFLLLLWKNMVLQKRRKVLTLFQVLIPAAFSLILLLIRTRVKSEFIATPTHRDSFEVTPQLPPYIINTVRSYNISSSSGLPNPFALAYAPNSSDVVRRIMTRLMDANSFQLNPKSLLLGRVSIDWASCS